MIVSIFKITWRIKFVSSIKRRIHEALKKFICRMGQFKDGKMHGTGTITFADGEKYIGDWIEGKRTGRGVFTWSDGDRYEGEFKDNERHGTGKMTYANGKVTHGRWSNSVFVS
jgi:hypothetical protein